MIQFDPALAAPAGNAAAPSGVADIASGGDAAFHDFLRELDRRRDGDDDFRQREAGRGTEPNPAAPTADTSAAAEPPRANSSPGDAPPNHQGVAETGSAAERPTADAAAAETSDAVEESRPEESTVAAGSVDAAAIRSAPATSENPSADAALSTDAGPDGDAVASQATSSSAHGARRRAGPGAQPQEAGDPNGPGSAAQGAADAAFEQHTGLAESENVLDSTQAGKPGANKAVGASVARAANPAASGQTGPAELPSPTLAVAELAIVVAGGDQGADVSDEGQPVEGETAGDAPRLSRSRRDHRRLSVANDAAAANANGALETASDGAPAGSTTLSPRTAGLAAANLGGLLAESSANDPSGGLTESIAAVEPGSPADQGRLGAPGERAADLPGQRDGASGKTPGTNPLARGSAEPSAHAADRSRFVQRVMHALQAAEARGTAVRLRLSPPELGSLRLELTVRDGALLARLEVETASARSLLLDSLPQLRERLAAQEIKIERFEVDLMNQHASDWSHGARDQGHAGNAGGHGLLADGEAGSTPDEILVPSAVVHLLDAGGINVLV